jgi:hypothetical protein
MKSCFPFSSSATQEEKILKSLFHESSVNRVLPSMKGISEKRRHSELANMKDPDVIAYSTVM